MLMSLWLSDVADTRDNDIKLLGIELLQKSWNLTLQGTNQSADFQMLHFKRAVYTKNS